MNKSLLLAVLSAVAMGACGGKPPTAPVPAAKPSLDVSLVTPLAEKLPRNWAAFGGVQPWQEVSLGAEVGGMRLQSLLVEVGDSVRKGQVIARFNQEVLLADLAQQQAALQEGEASAEQAGLNAERARKLQPKGAISEQDLQLAIATEKTTAARVAQLKAQVASTRLKVGYAELRAPDDGVVASRMVAPGQVLAAGTEVVRLIRQGRLEWRAELAAERLAEIKPGYRARVTTAVGVLEGVVRKVSPQVDAATKTGLVYVDIPAARGLPAGSFVSGEILGDVVDALTLPATAVVIKDGSQQVATVTADNRVRFQKVVAQPATAGRYRVEGVAPDLRVIKAGGNFLAGQDQVRVIEAAK